MALYTVEAFNWSSFGYNATYTSSVIAILDDDDPAYEGGADSDEMISINGGAFGATAASPYAIDISFTDTSGDPHVETFYFFNTGGDWYFVPAPGSAFTVGATLGSYQTHTTGWNYADITCFCRGTLIETTKGPMPVEDLRAGMVLVGPHGEEMPLKLHLQRRVTAQELVKKPKLRPVRICAGALGQGLPKRDLLVSRQHRILLRSTLAKRMFGSAEVLVAAIKLTGLPGVFVDEQLASVDYFHLVLENHEIVISEGLETESFLIAPNALNALSPEARGEIEMLFPDLDQKVTPATARFVPEGKQQKQLINKHIADNSPVLAAPISRH